ncbi:MAG: helix-turn-helix domain-containing protein [Plesiomonas shigelloides]
MNGFELRLWRTGLGWEQERAAEELQVSRRTYQSYEKKGPPHSIVLASQAISIREELRETDKGDDALIARIKSIMSLN